MSTSDSAVQRDAGGRFLPGQSGNPLGKAPGTRNRATRLRQILEDGEDRIIGRILIDKAKGGDAVAARFVIARLMPRPRGRAIALDLPEGTWAGDPVATFNATMMAMASGEITPDEALTVTRTFDGRLKALKAYEMERYLTRWEPIPGDTAFEEKEEEEEAEEVYEDEPAPTAAQSEPSPCGREQDEGAAPANDLHCGESPHPNPLPQAGEGVNRAKPSDARAAAPAEPSPLGRGQGEGVSPANDLPCGAHPHPNPPEQLSNGPEGEGASLHSACIQASPATLAGRRLVAQQALRQWARTLPG
jgi:hypothetical protein